LQNGGKQPVSSLYREENETFYIEGLEIPKSLDSFAQPQNEKQDQSATVHFRRRHRPGHQLLYRLTRLAHRPTPLPVQFRTSTPAVGNRQLAALEFEISASKPSADARIISCSSLNANSIAAPSAR
jgi:hypothetical protein